MSILKNSSAKSSINVKTIFPEVISASRATDIPAYHAAWFINRLRAGYCEWQNPFNANQKQVVSFAETNAIVFWSKNPAPLIPYLSEITDYGIKFYFQFTLNDYKAEGLEPGVPALMERIKTFKYLAQKYKVIWRYDPVVFGGGLTVTRHIHIIKYLMEHIGNYTEKLVFSFVDLYGRVDRNLKSFNTELRAPDLDEMRQFSLELVELRDKISPRLQLATCAEAEIDFAAMGIDENSCIDPDLINKLCNSDIYKNINIKLHQSQRPLLEQLLEFPSYVKIFEKDKGQRKDCKCAPSKDIGSYRHHPCSHHCIYCYAGHAMFKYH